MNRYSVEYLEGRFDMKLEILKLIERLKEDCKSENFTLDDIKRMIQVRNQNNVRIVGSAPLIRLL